MRNEHFNIFVADPQAQINEAYRVLEDGGVCGISMVHKISNSKMIYAFHKLVFEFGTEINEPYKFEYLTEPGVLKELFVKAGFQSIKVFTHNIIGCSTPNEIISITSHHEPFKSIIAGLTDESRSSMVEKYLEVYEEMVGDKTNDVDSLLFLIVIAKK